VEEEEDMEEEGGMCLGRGTCEGREGGREGGRGGGLYWENERNQKRKKRSESSY
jgi:hypothetical protein